MPNTRCYAHMCKNGGNHGKIIILDHRAKLTRTVDKQGKPGAQQGKSSSSLGKPGKNRAKWGQTQAKAAKKDQKHGKAGPNQGFLLTCAKMVGNMGKAYFFWTKEPSSQERWTTRAKQGGDQKCPKHGALPTCQKWWETWENYIFFLEEGATVRKVAKQATSGQTRHTKKAQAGKRVKRGANWGQNKANAANKGHKDGKIGTKQGLFAHRCKNGGKHGKTILFWKKEPH